MALFSSSNNDRIQRVIGVYVDDTILCGKKAFLHLPGQILEKYDSKESELDNITFTRLVFIYLPQPIESSSQKAYTSLSFALLLKTHPLKTTALSVQSLLGPLTLACIFLVPFPELPALPKINSIQKSHKSEQDNDAPPGTSQHISFELPTGYQLSPHHRIL